MVDIFLFLGAAFLLTLLIGRLLEKISVPWIFSALLIGTALSAYNPFQTITSSQTFNFLSQLGMYFLLFVIGFEIDLKKLSKSKAFIFKSTIFIILITTILGAILIHFAFNYSWLISILVSISFATVGEAILIPILDEFKLVNTKLGQSIIGIGTLDDIIEILLLILVGILVGTASHSANNIAITLLSLFILFAMTILLTKLKNKKETKFKFISIETLFLFTLSILFLFLGIGEIAKAAPIAAILAGIGLNTFMPDNRVKKITSEIKSLCYGFFAPIFFLGVGMTINIKYLLISPLLILLIILVSAGSKIFASYIVGKKELGTKKSILLGIGLSVKFSTSIIIIKILFENNIINSNLYSIIVASSIIFNFLIPFLFSRLILKWNINKK
jgi:Kef-type K+ transport system membrane component KefB